MNIEQIIDCIAGNPETGSEQIAAAKLNVHQTTISSWKKAGRIPQWHWEPIIELSEGKINADILLKACTVTEK